MLTKQSRYYKLDNQAFERSDGVVVESKQLRAQPEVEGKIFYLIESGDRIDHLAYKFFDRSKQWWHICDANPEYYSPKELLGTSPIKHLRIIFSFLGYQPEWTVLFSTLQQQLGVQHVRHGSDGMIKPDTQITYSVVMSLATLPDTTQILFNQAILTQSIPVALGTLLSGEGITLSNNVRVRKYGENIWYLDDVENEIIYACVLTLSDDPTPDVINVFAATISHNWEMEIFYNENSVSLEALLDEVQSSGFDVERYDLIGRVGKKIAVPTKYFG